MELLIRGALLDDAAGLFPRRIIAKTEAVDFRGGSLQIGAAHRGMLAESNAGPGPRGVWPAHADGPSQRTSGSLALFVCGPYRSSFRSGTTARLREGRSPIALRSYDTYSSSLARPWLSPNYDLDILVERRQQIHQTFNRKPRQLVVTKRRDLGLCDSQHLGGVGLRKLAHFKHLVQCVGQPQLRLTLGGVGKPEISEHVSTAPSDPFSPLSMWTCHRAPHRWMSRLFQFWDVYTKASRPGS